MLQIKIFIFHNLNLFEIILGLENHGFHQNIKQHNIDNTVIGIFFLSSKSAY